MSDFDKRIYLATLLCTALATLAVFAGVWYGLPIRRRERIEKR